MNRKTFASFNHQLTFLARPKRYGRWILATLAAIVGGAAYVSLLEMPPVAEDATSASTKTQPRPALVAAPRPVKKVEIDYVVKPNDTLGQIFTVLKIDVNELPGLLNSAVAREKFKALRPGDKLTIALRDGVLHGVKRRISDHELVSITRGANGFTAAVVATPFEIKTAQVRGTINASLFAAGRAVGLTPEIAQQLANNIFGWQVDFARDIRPGDRFNVVYEQKYRDQAYAGDGRIVAAELVSNGETYRAVRYTSPDGKIDDYFTPDGHSVRRPLLRAPIDLTRVTPSTSERKPIITLMREHRGIDYPAAAGTAVKAAGDGRIKFIADNGEYGNSIIIEHGGGRSTLYAHLSGFAKNAGLSQHVKQGETIGYVGNTGAATAPHLHYEYRVNGTATDPRTPATPTGAPLPAQYLADFQSKSAALFASLENGGEAVAMAPVNK